MVSHVMELTEAGFSPEAIAKEYHGIISPAAVREARLLIKQGVVKEVSGKGRVVAWSSLIMTLLIIKS